MGLLRKKGRVGVLARTKSFGGMRARLAGLGGALFGADL